MKKYKINLGTCGGRAINTSIISAENERDAVIKYLQGIDEEVTEEKINQYMKGVFEHIPKPRSTVDIKPLKRANVKTLNKICEEIVDIEEGLMFGSILFQYDNLMSAMKPGHPMEILDSLLANIYFTVMGGKEPPMEKLEETLKNFKGFKTAFAVKEMNKPIKELSDYIKARKLGKASK